MSQRSAKSTQPTYLYAPICRQKGIDATLDKKSQRWIVLKCTAIVGIFLLAAAGMPLSRQMLPLTKKITFEPQASS
jgi:hypothetical protein